MKPSKLSGIILCLVLLKAFWNCIDPNNPYVEWMYVHFWIAITLILTVIEEPKGNLS